MEHINKRKWLPHLMIGIIFSFVFLHVITRNVSVGTDGGKIYSFSYPSNTEEMNASKQIMSGRSGSLMEDLCLVYKEIMRTIKTAIQTIKQSLFSWPTASVFSIG